MLKYIMGEDTRVTLSTFSFVNFANMYWYNYFKNINSITAN